MIRNFEQLQKYLNSIPNINHGGCGIAALVMYRWLKQRGEKSYIVYCYKHSSFERELYSSNVGLKKGDENSSPASCSHAFVECNKKYYDSSGEDPSVIYCYRHVHRLSEELVIRTINESPFWRELFNRSYLKHISKKTGVDLSDIKLHPGIW